MLELNCSTSIFGRLEELGTDVGKKTVTVEFAYPLREAVRFDLELPDDARVADLIDAVCIQYAVIYKEEDETKTAPESDTGQLLNRGATNGKYGISGHVLEDLFIESITEGEDGIFRLGIGS